MKDEEFICNNCGFKVAPLGYTARDHCPHCLYSKHVDVFPGDRGSTCQGELIPIAVEINKKAGYKIVYRCLKCKSVTKNIMAEDDDMDLVIELSTNQISYSEDKY